MRWIRAVIVLSLAAAGAYALRRWSPVRVAGPSMEPTLFPGDLVATRPPSRGEPRVGQVVVIGGTPEVIKRVAHPPVSARTDSDLWVVGDNSAHSTDSRVRGFVPREDVVGIARAVYWPLKRIKLLG